MKTTIIDRLACPICSAPMQKNENGSSCICRGGRCHCFDFSKRGYLNLAGPQGGSGDTKEAVLARRSFLDAGYYQPLANELERLLSALNCQSVLDAGCGEGYYTDWIAQGRDVLGVDLSRDGIDFAARRTRQTGRETAFVVASLFTLPVADESFDAVINLFAPCAEQEFLRVLRPGGYLILVGAGERHLMGLKEHIYDDPYVNPGRADLPQEMQLTAQLRLTDEITVQGSDRINALFSMTPYYWRTSKRDKEKLEHMDCLTTEIDFDIFVFRKGLT